MERLPEALTIKAVARLWAYASSLVKGFTADSGVVERGIRFKGVGGRQVEARQRFVSFGGGASVGCAPHR
jgi:hypothetical protein